MIWIVGFGGVLGSICRYLIAVKLSNKQGSFPIATFAANLSGSFILGCIYALYIEKTLPEEIWLFLGIGFLGSYTTLSTFGFEVIQLIENRKIKLAGLYVFSSVFLGLITAWIGWQIIP